MSEQQRRKKRPISGWLVLDKPFDMTSTQAVGKVRWLFAAEKAGHAGTLDPLATGILPIALGEATKTVSVVQDGRKVYRFTVRWGAATTTDDAEGEVIASSEVRPSPEAISAVLPQFTGEITQVPPAFSAIRIEGERAYDLARAGEAPVMAPRQAVVHALKLLDSGPETADFEAVCKKGTYVRALARDMAEALGTKGHIARLHRAAVGHFTQGMAVSLADVENAGPEDRDRLLLPLLAGLAGVSEVRLSPAEASVIRNGNPVLLRGANAPVMLDEAWASAAGEAIALGSVQAGQFHPRRVFAKN